MQAESTKKDHMPAYISDDKIRLGPLNPTGTPDFFAVDFASWAKEYEKLNNLMLPEGDGSS